MGESLLTGGVSTPPQPPYAPPPRAGARWRGWAEIRADLRAAAWLVLVLALTGLPTGVLWWLLAPRADFEITADGPVVIGQPSEELVVADETHSAQPGTSAWEGFGR